MGNTTKNVLTFARSWLISNNFYSTTCDVAETLPTDTSCPTTDPNCCLSEITSTAWTNLQSVISGDTGELDDDQKFTATYAYACYLSERKLKLDYVNIKNLIETTKSTVRNATTVIHTANKEKNKLKSKTLSKCKNSEALAE